MRYPSGPLAPWFDEDDDERGDYAWNLALEHARAVLACRLEDRLAALKHAGVDEVLQELHKQIVELAAEGRLSELQELVLQGKDVLENR